MYYTSTRITVTTMAQRQHPVLVMLHGGGHGHPKYFEILQNMLQTEGFSIISGTNPSDGGTNFTPGQSFYDDAAYWREKILSVINNEQDVVLFMHSVAGPLGIEAAKGLGKADRERSGKKGSVVHLIFLAGYLPNEGDHVFSFYDGTRANCPTRAAFRNVCHIPSKSRCLLLATIRNQCPANSSLGKWSRRSRPSSILRPLLFRFK